MPGGFDEAFTSGHEDVEFGYRFFTSCGRAGGFAYDPAACVHLAHFRCARDAMAASAPDLAHFRRKHPRTTPSCWHWRRQRAGEQDRALRRHPGQAQFRHGEFDAVVHADLWRFLMPGDLSLAITEGLRIARRVYLVASADPWCGEAGGARMRDIDYVADAIRPPVTVREVTGTPAARILAVSGT